MRRSILHSQRSAPSRWRAARARIAALAALVALLGGCEALLPKTAQQTNVGWANFDDARRTIESFVPYQTTRSEIAAKGIDPYENPAVSLLSFSDILQRFAASSAMRPEDFDPGIRDCLTSGKRCTGYSILVQRTKRDRVGNFWLDSLNFRREIDTSGFIFNALVILVDDVVVYTLYGGQPNISNHEVIRNPLGPLQGWGDQVPGLLR